MFPALTVEREPVKFPANILKLISDKIREKMFSSEVVNPRNVGLMHPATNVEVSKRPLISITAQKQPARKAPGGHQCATFINTDLAAINP
jgi:hypothetical protein